MIYRLLLVISSVIAVYSENVALAVILAGYIIADEIRRDA